MRVSRSDTLRNESRGTDRTGGRLSLAMLQAENQRLRAQLEAMLSEARLNQEKMRRFDQLERQVIGAACLAELIRTLLLDPDGRMAKIKRRDFGLPWPVR